LGGSADYVVTAQRLADLIEKEGERIVELVSRQR
jgi:hypothetical protein